MARLRIFSLALALAMSVVPTAGGQEIPSELQPIQNAVDAVTPSTPPPSLSALSASPAGPASTQPTSDSTGSTSPATVDGSDPEPTTSEPAPLVVDGSTERDLAGLINSSRRANNRRPLRFFKRLAGIAREHSQKMASAGHIFHGLKATAKRIRSWDWVELGENVGVGASPESLHRAFMNSAPHRRNILKGKFRRVGVGMTASDGRIWVTVIFYR